MWPFRRRVRGAHLVFGVLALISPGVGCAHQGAACTTTQREVEVGKSPRSDWDTILDPRAPIDEKLKAHVRLGHATEDEADEIKRNREYFHSNLPRFRENFLGRWVLVAGGQEHVFDKYSEMIQWKEKNIPASKPYMGLIR